MIGWPIRISPRVILAGQAILQTIVRLWTVVHGRNCLTTGNRLPEVSRNNRKFRKRYFVGKLPSWYGLVCLWLYSDLILHFEKYMVPFSRLECHTKVGEYLPFAMDHGCCLSGRVVVHGRFEARLRYLKFYYQLTVNRLLSQSDQFQYGSISKGINFQLFDSYRIKGKYVPRTQFLGW